MEKQTAVVLVSEIKTLIEQSKQQLAVTVNAALSRLYWQIGKRVQKWSVRVLQERIQSMLYERTSISKKQVENYGQNTLKLRIDGTGQHRKRF